MLGGWTQSTLGGWRLEFAELLVEYRIPSASIGILHKGRTIGLAVGVKELSTGEPATTDTIYQLGSMTKTWTASRSCSSWTRGRSPSTSRYGATSQRFVSPIPKPPPVTPRHLLNHTNGIEEVFGQPAKETMSTSAWSKASPTPQVFPLGHTHGYSAALGYAILARIMEVVDGRGWDEIMRRRIIEPLGLSSTSTQREDVEPERAATAISSAHSRSHRFARPCRTYRAPTVLAATSARRSGTCSPWLSSSSTAAEPPTAGLSCRPGVLWR